MIDQIVPTGQILLHGVLALFGALVHALKSHRSGNSKTLSDILMLTTMASFSGVMFAIIGLQIFEDQVYLSLAMAGTGGFLGVEGMSIVVEKIRELLLKK